jgi:NhaA family Na+:H+ antiporter
VAGVLLGFAVPVLARPGAQVECGADDAGPTYEGLAPHFADRWEPVSTVVAVPVFALFSAGVTVDGLSGLRSALDDPITLGIIAGLVVGKPIGILGSTFLLTRLPGFRLNDGLRWPDLTGMALVAGIGFTISLLVGELSYGHGIADDHVKIGVLGGSVCSALLGAVVLAHRNRYWRNQAAADASGGALSRPG